MDSSKPTGYGAVRVHPDLHEGTTGTVMIELCALPDIALIEVQGEDLSLFLAEISDLVPVGTEPSHMDIDTLVAALLDTHNN